MTDSMWVYTTDLYPYISIFRINFLFFTDYVIIPKIFCIFARQRRDAGVVELARLESE